jgi:hypothetical protein
MIDKNPGQIRFSAHSFAKLEYDCKDILANTFHIKSVFVKRISQDNILKAAMGAGQNGCIVRPDIYFFHL